MSTAETLPEPSQLSEITEAVIIQFPVKANPVNAWIAEVGLQKALEDY